MAARDGRQENGKDTMDRREPQASATYYLLLALACGILFLTNNLPNHVKNLRLASEERSLIQDVHRLNDRVDSLRQEIHGLQSDPYLIEKTLRETLRQVRPGEELVVRPAGR